MAHSWPAKSEFSRLTLNVLDRDCAVCGVETHVKDYKERRLYLLNGPTQLVSQMTLCADTTCAGHHHLVTAEEETIVAPPWWILGWDAFAHLGHARFSRHWSVPEIQEDLAETYEIRLSEDAIEDYIGRYQAILAARQRDPGQLKKAYGSAKKLLLSIDGLQPEKGHETLYTVRELSAKRVWFAVPLLSSSHDEVKRLFVRAKALIDMLGIPLEGWISDKQDAFVTGIAEVFPRVPHRYCQNHFLRDVAEPVLEADSHAKVQMRKKVRGLRAIEKEILEVRNEPAQRAARPSKPEDPPKKTDRHTVEESTARDRVVLGYCAAVRGVLNKNQGGPLDPPGMRMAEGLKEIRVSIQKSIDAHHGGSAERHLERLAACIDRGLTEVEEALLKIPCYLGDLLEVYHTLDPDNGSTAQRKATFRDLCRRLRVDGDPIRSQMADVMTRFEPGLFAGGDRLDHVRDNLDLERWFRLPKSHERRIHGRQHAGIRIVHEGPSIVLALDAHHDHRRPFTEEELRPYLGATPTAEELEAIDRRKTMRRAASRKARSRLLAALEMRYGVREQPRKRCKRASHESGG